MAQIHIEMTTEEVRQVVLAHLESKLGDRDLDPKAVVIEVKSKQNYKSEWEPAEFRAVYKGSI